MVEESPAAYISAVLVRLNGRLFLHLCFLCSVCHRVLSSPPVKQHQPLLQSRTGLFKESPTPQADGLLTGRYCTPPPSRSSVILFSYLCT